MSEEASEENIHPEVKSSRGFNPVWIVPLVALLLGLWLVKRSHDEKGELIKVRFENAADLDVGKTEVKCRNVTIGEVEDILLTDGLEVDVTLRIKPDHLHLVREGSQFWVVRARVQGSSVSGLGTLISGAYIELDPGLVEGEVKRQRSFLGLEAPPLTPASVPGLRLVLESTQPGSVDIGSGIYYHDTVIGKVESREFLPEEKVVRFGVFIGERYRDLVSDQTLFWKTSGVKLDVGADGFNLELPSLDSLVSGRISVDEPVEAVDGAPLMDGDLVTLYDTEELAATSRFRGGTEFLLLIDKSLKGLKRGAAVEFRGLRIGRVSDISYALVDNPKINEMPVLIQLDTRLLERHFPESLVDMEAGSFIEQISSKLQATISSSNFITGQMIVELNYYPDYFSDGPVVRNGYTVLPVVESGFSRLEEGIANLLEKINELGLEDLIANLAKTADQTTEALAGIEAAVLDEEGVVIEARDALASLNVILQDEGTRALPADFRQTLARLNDTLEPLSEDGVIYGDLRRTLDELRGTARSIERLTGEITDKPNSLLFGKDGNTSKIPRGRR